MREPPADGYPRLQALVLKEMWDLLNAYRMAGPEGPLKQLAADHLDEIEKSHQAIINAFPTLGELTA